MIFPSLPLIYAFLFLGCHFVNFMHNDVWKSFAGLSFWTVSIDVKLAV